MSPGCTPTGDPTSDCQIKTVHFSGSFRPTLAHRVKAQYAYDSAR
eukprot:CAMPEP_0167826984 /NCGR_PEP_ID=MMETSP0112_2-20121227/10405_1 /TAXON_ID=91324 /ORGANISM="Lotharella globosa, Strain CCCM811" /LENGTH=44 /DNA_ID= /DNA_START= /DNA_END= /DNA_ORIENTATION=